MIGRFSDQVAVISGGGDGLGRAIAFRLAGEGAKVVLFDISAAALENTLEDLRAAGYTAVGWKADVSREADVVGGYTKAYETFGRVDIVVNSAGMVGPTNTSILDYSTEDYDKVYGVNLRGTFLMAKYGLGYMVKQGYGRMLLIASIAGKEGNPFMAGYSSTKAGVIGLVKGLGKEFADKGITINGLAPAVIKTAMNQDTAPEQLAYMTSRIPMGRLGTVDEVAAMAGFIVSPENSFSTGFIYDVSGGRATY
ncbi:SDR family NAD(P)-dependent oxidoreductase [Parapedobacter soli]|uniref:SDR family NAD(P)-dependent oxidoreductase n=1 Tax=Parapedobacter soli TaxID=416955 RepID=UPI0021C9B85F|nr:SDR family NAD(P)-dependent oxidoreductase [Parapedobacter soli]